MVTTGSSAHFGFSSSSQCLASRSYHRKCSTRCRQIFSFRTRFHIEIDHAHDNEGKDKVQTEPSGEGKVLIQLAGHRLSQSTREELY